MLFFLCWPLEHDRPRELHESIYTAKKALREKVPGARCCQVPTAACCLLSARYPHPEQAPASGPPPCPPASSKRHLAAVEPGQRCTLRSSCTLAALSACLLPTFFCRRSAGSHVRPKLASCRAPSRTLILRLHAHLCGSPPMAAPQREMSDPSSARVCVQLAPSSQLLPSGYCHPFTLFLSIPWRAFRSSTATSDVSMGKPASIWLAWAKRPGQPRMPQNRPWQADLLQESPRNPVLLGGCMQPHLMVRLGRSSLKHMSH